TRWRGRPGRGRRWRLAGCFLRGQQRHEVADRPGLADLTAGDDDLAAVESGIGVLDLEDLATVRVGAVNPLAAQRWVQLITIAAARTDGGDMHVQTPWAEHTDANLPSLYPGR